jgi:hypothetical protein
VETVARYGDCQIFALKFQRQFHQYATSDMHAGTNESLTAPAAIMSAHKANGYYGECLIKLHLTVHRNNQLSSLQPVCLEAGGTRELWADLAL